MKVIVSLFCLPATRCTSNQVRVRVNPRQHEYLTAFFLNQRSQTDMTNCTVTQLCIDLSARLQSATCLEVRARLSSSQSSLRARLLVLPLLKMCKGQESNLQWPNARHCYWPLDPCPRRLAGQTRVRVRVEGDPLMGSN